MNQEIEIKFKKGTHIEQIERSCFYLMSIFSALDSDPISGEHPLPSNAIADFSHIGTAFTNLIYEKISDFVEPDEDKQMNTDELLNVSEFIETGDKTDDLAVSLSNILNNPELPITLYNAFQTAIADVYSDGDNERLNSFESSPEFLKAVIEASKKDES